jgi:TonB-linked SusC/RagA family outer membrane protein
MNLYLTRSNSVRNYFLRIIVIMKFTCLALVTLCLQISHAANAQLISISKKNVSLKEVFNLITAQSNTNILYTAQMLEKSKPVTIELKNVSLADALKKCLEGQSLSFTIEGNTIILKQQEHKVPVYKPIQIQVQEELNGLVVDTTGLPLPGASVVIKGTNVGTQTDNKGTFSFPNLADNAILVISYTGFISQEIAVGKRTTLKVILKENGSSLSEVAVVAFGTQKRTDMVGSITTIKPDDLRVPSSNLTTALAGRAAGVIAYQRSGEPGADDASFFIRGITSFGTGKVDPLLLIDGVELGVTELSRLRPDDIESFNIMKDATATALYGARGANGVISVVTKQGKEGKAVIMLRAEGSMSSPTSFVEFADPVQYMQLYNEAQLARDPFAVPYYKPEKIDGTREGLNSIVYPATDWRKELFSKQTNTQRYNMSVSGGGKTARYYIAGSMAQDNGNLKVDQRNNFNSNIDLKSYTLRANVNVNLTKTTEIIVRLNGNFDLYTGPIEGGAAIYNKVIRTNPVDFPAFYPIDEEHSYVKHIMFGGKSSGSFLNPYADMVKGYRNYDRSLMLAQLNLNQNLEFITEGLKFRSTFNTNKISRFDINRAYKPFFYALDTYDPSTLDYSVRLTNEAAGEEYLNFALGNREQSSIFYLDAALDYSRTFSKDHTLSGLLVYIMRSGLSATKADDLQSSLPSRNLGVSGRTTYSYKSKYFAEFNFGYNGSERFYKDKRFGFFPSAGVAWSVSNEKFWEPLKNTFNNLRVRATYGLVGNDAIGLATDRFFYLSNVNMDAGGDRSARFGTNFQNSKNGIVVNRYSNPDITWETAYKTNLALEIGLFNAFQIQADFYHERRKNILMNRADIPTTMGNAAAIQANVGEASGKGMDWSINYNHNFSNGIWLQGMVNFTYATSKFEVFEEPLYDKEWWKSRVGLPIKQPMGYIAERLFVDDSDVANSPPQGFGAKNIAGDIKYKDVNGDGKITTLDQVPLSFPTEPEIVYGAGFSMGYKGFDISMFFQGLAQESFWISPAHVQPFVDGKQILKAFADDHYSLSKPDIYALWPRLSTTNQANNTQLSTWWLRNGSFIRLKSAEFGYALPRKTANKLHVKTMRMYLSGSNLFLLSSFKLWDIEMGGNGLYYPLQRVLNVGVNVTF